MVLEHGNMREATVIRRHSDRSRMIDMKICRWCVNCTLDLPKAKSLEC